MPGPSRAGEHSSIVKKLCFYHAGCPDGFGAAWSVRSAWGEEAHYIARGHDDRVRPGECDDALVAFVDIAPMRDELLQLAQSAAQILIVDHHVTARNRLACDPGFVDEIEAEGHVLHFDMNHSAAVLAWQYFRPNDPLPDLLRYVEDQDLWNWVLPNSEAINAAIAWRGGTIESPRAFREMLLNSGDEVVRTVTEKLMTYALGRGVDFFDAPAVRRIVGDLARNDYRWSSLVLGIVESDSFQMRRAPDADGVPVARR